MLLIAFSCFQQALANRAETGGFAYDHFAPGTIRALKLIVCLTPRLYW
jgi:hypothetical protein